MKRFGEFLKTTALGGLFVMLPVLLLYLLISEALDLVVALATPIADLFPKGTFDKINTPVLIGIILLVGASFIIGLIMRSRKGRGLGNWMERTVFERLPGYTALKHLTRGFQDLKEGGAFRPALLKASDGMKDVVYVIEDHEDGNMTVLVPQAPAAFSGFVRIVSRDRVEMMDANLGDVTRVLGYWGLGMRDLVGGGNRHSPPSRS